LDNLRDLPVRFWRGSIVDDEALREVFLEEPQFVFHLAANFANQNSIDYPQRDLLVNGLGTLKLLQYCLDHRVQRFVYASSSCVYGPMDGPISESVRDYSLDTPYAVTKLLGEQYVNFFNLHHGLPTVILRFFNSYGPGEYPGKYRNVIPNFMYCALRGEPLTITGTGAETRDFTYVEDTVGALQLAMWHPAAPGRTLNSGTGTETTIRDLAGAILAVCSSKSEVRFRPARVWDSVTRRVADISLIRSALGYEPKTRLREGLTRTMEWFLERQLASLPQSNLR
jgi:nucleoside-diphosphate-sugar epimerase